MSTCKSQPADDPGCPGRSSSPAPILAGAFIRCQEGSLLSSGLETATGPFSMPLWPHSGTIKYHTGNSHSFVCSITLDLDADCDLSLQINIHHSATQC